MISLRSVTKAYGNLSVYKDFDLEIGEGITCLLGESGSGKTTLLNILAGLTSFKGEVTPKLKCSYVFQTPRLLPNLTVEGNLKLVCENKSEIEAILERVGLSDKAKSYPCELSGGQAQRVALARAFIYASDLILLDEPFSSLDLKIKLEVIKLFHSLVKERKKTALFVTHDIDEAVMLSDRILLLKDGKIALDLDGENNSCPSYGSNLPLKQKILDEILK